MESSLTIRRLQLVYRHWRYCRQNSIKDLLASIEHYLDTNDPQMYHFWPSLGTGFPKNWVYKGNALWRILPSFVVEASSLTIFFRSSFVFTYLPSLFWIYCCYCYHTSSKFSAIMPSAQNTQSLPSLNLVAHRSDHYTTILPNLSYPSRPNAHVPWSGSSAPLLFAVS